MEFTYYLGEIDSTAKKIVENQSSNILLFYGEMGSGKTTLINSIVRLLGSEDAVSSPTYSLVNEYKAEGKKIFHFDLFRIKDEKEALDFGFDEYLINKDFILIEWPEKIINLLHQEVDVISLKPNIDASRTLKFNQNIDLTDKKHEMPQIFY